MKARPFKWMVLTLLVFSGCSNHFSYDSRGNTLEGWVVRVERMETCDEHEVAEVELFHNRSVFMVVPEGLSLTVRSLMGVPVRVTYDTHDGFCPRKTITGITKVFN